MNIAILTQPLMANYGGILQNYAIQQVLKQLGHRPITIEQKYAIKETPLFSIPKRAISKYFLRRKIKIFEEKAINKRELLLRSKLYPFIAKKINRVYFNDWNTINISEYDTIIVGSDQVWRPIYNCEILDKMFLSFIPDNNIKRIAYAASFGSDKWEFTEQQTIISRDLIKRFDAISIREDSGIKLFKDYLGGNATQVLDPTLLLSKEQYCELCADVPKQDNYLCAYMLDICEAEYKELELFANKKGLKLKIFSADEDCTLTVEEWLATFRDAKLIITNSFHGIIFSIIFNKDFYYLYHPTRGIARITSLFRSLNIPQDRIKINVTEIQHTETTLLDWFAINSLLLKQKQDSIQFLINALDINQQIKCLKFQS